MANYLVKTSGAWGDFAYGAKSWTGLFRSFSNFLRFWLSGRLGAASLGTGLEALLLRGFMAIPPSIQCSASERSRPLLHESHAVVAAKLDVQNQHRPSPERRRRDAFPRKAPLHRSHQDVDVCFVMFTVPGRAIFRHYEESVGATPMQELVLLISFGLPLEYWRR